MKSRVCFVFLLLAGSVAAQLNAGTIIHRIRVRVAFLNGGCDLSTHVRLMGRGGLAAEGVANDQCIVDFANIPAGIYHLIASGQSFAETDAGSITMDSTGSNEFEIKVRRPNEPERTDGVPVSPIVSAVDLVHARELLDLEPRDLPSALDDPRERPIETGRFLLDLLEHRLGEVQTLLPLVCL